MVAAMDPAALTVFLAPALGFLLDAGKDVAERARQSLGEATWKQATKLWDKLRGKVESDPGASSAAERLAQVPDDVEARATLTFLLRRILEEDAALGAELARDWEEARSQTTAIASAEGAVAMVGSHRNIVVTGGGSVGDKGRDGGPGPRDR